MAVTTYADVGQRTSAVSAGRPGRALSSPRAPQIKSPTGNVAQAKYRLGHDNQATKRGIVGAALG